MEENKGQNVKLIRDQYQTKVAWYMFGIIFIFGIPAWLGLKLGTYLRDVVQLGSHSVGATLFCSWVFSWIIMYFIYKRINKNLDALDKAVIEAKK